MGKENRFKNGDKVVMHSCIEGRFHNGKIWTCNGDSFQNSNATEVVFLKGVSGTFQCKCLQKVNIE